MSKRGSSSSEREVSSTKDDKLSGGDLSLSNGGNKGPQVKGTSSRGNNNSFFVVSVTGRIESAQIFGVDDIYCKFSIAAGNDWYITAGMEEGISQVTGKDPDGNFVWNFPLEVTFRSTNPHGWPQLVVSVYGADFLGNHVARGYGATHLPISHGSFTKIVPLFVPESSSFVQKITAWLMGRQPELVDPKVLAFGDGRQVVRVRSGGHVTVKFEVITKDFAKGGYTSSPKCFNDSYFSS